jgi:hypothetical protein
MAKQKEELLPKIEAIGDVADEPERAKFEDSTGPGQRVVDGRYDEEREPINYL